ncbi:MAG: M1 family metallopeptidase, partial [Bacteroidales bacterium]|nr:M1 family metallopeptidase [Bacteroidales bacterium]
MKSFLSFILLFISFSIFGQVADIHPDEFKSNSMFKQKSDYQLYYNPLLDKYDIHFLKLDLNVTDQSTYIFGNATIVGKAQGGPLDTLVFDFKDNMIVDSMLINGINRVASRSNNEITSIFSPEIPDGEEFNVQVYYHGTPSGDGVSSYLSSTWGKRVTWTLSESFHAYEWWPCKQVLSDKIDSAYLFFTCDDDCMVGSNGLLRNVTSLPNNKERYEWKTYHPINYYLISFAVSEYQDYSIYANPVGSDPVLIQNFIYNHPNCLANYKSEIDQTASFIELFSEKFGLYPFADEKYGHCLALLGGGMEHQTMTTLNSFSYNLVSHELAHQWFGDYVTCASWQDIWINEGFASYCEYIALENLSSYSTAQSWLTNAYSQAMQSPTGSVYIPFENAMDESRIFSGSLSYKKGAALLHMIRYQINNDEQFYLALQN